MTKSLSNWQHAVMSLCILILFVIGLHLILLQPALTARKEYQERIDDYSFQLNKFRNTEYRIVNLQNQIERLKQQDPDNGNYLEDKSPSLVAAELQKQLKTLIETNGGNLVSTHVITTTDDELFPKVTIKVHMQAEMDTLQTVFYKLAVNKPILFTRNVQIQKRHTSSRRQKANTGKLEIRFDVTGYIYKSVI
jgi:hypothetical protein